MLEFRCVGFLQLTSRNELNKNARIPVHCKKTRMDGPESEGEIVFPEASPASGKRKPRAS